jgi:hypothetical protein
MGYVIQAAVFAIALVVVVHLLLRTHREAEAVYMAERRELLNRIQRPDYLPAANPVDLERFQLPDEPDEIELINTIAEPPGDSQ